MSGCWVTWCLASFLFTAVPSESSPVHVSSCRRHPILCSQTLTGPFLKPILGTQDGNHTPLFPLKSPRFLFVFICAMTLTAFTEQVLNLTFSASCTSYDPRMTKMCWSLFQSILRIWLFPSIPKLSCSHKFNHQWPLLLFKCDMYPFLYSLIYLYCFNGYLLCTL